MWVPRTKNRDGTLASCTITPAVVGEPSPQLMVAVKSAAVAPGAALVKTATSASTSWKPSTVVIVRGGLNTGGVGAAFVIVTISKLIASTVPLGPVMITSPGADGTVDAINFEMVTITKLIASTVPLGPVIITGPNGT